MECTTNYQKEKEEEKEISKLSELCYIMVCRNYIKIRSVIDLYKYFDKVK